MENTYLLGYDPTDYNHQSKTHECEKCGGKNFEINKQGDFRETIYVEICKQCGNKKS
jgi:hypothetical protein